jgi:putative phage-type endonuclease
MKIIELEQNTPEWLEYRLQTRTASELSTVMGVNKYQKLNELLELKKTGKSKPISDFLQKLFDKGHVAEDKARSILENEKQIKFKPLVGEIEIDGIKLLASFDGISEDHSVIFEHKLWNEKLAGQMMTMDIEHHYLWQIAQQMLVSGAKLCIFVTSDGTKDNWVSVHITREYLADMLGGLYESDITHAWADFNEKLESYDGKAQVKASDALELMYQRYAIQKAVVDEETAKLDEIKADINNKIKDIDADVIDGSNFTITKVERKGNISYKNVPELEGVDLEQYRGKSSFYFKYTGKK